MVHHAAVAECAVAGVPDVEWGQIIAAFVVLNDGASVTAEELRGYVRAHLRSSKTPDQIHFLPELPATPTGKILRRNLVTSALRA